MLNINKYTKPTVESINEDLEPLDVPTPSVSELATKWNVDEAAVEIEVAKGIEVEKEHTTDEAVASEITRDHLNEDLYYYDKLAKVEG